MKKLDEHIAPAVALLKGRRIVAVRYTDAEETDALGWDEPAPVIFLDNGAFLILQRDPEGNGPGGAMVYPAQEGEDGAYLF